MACCRKAGRPLPYLVQRPPYVQVVGARVVETCVGVGQQFLQSQVLHQLFEDFMTVALREALRGSGRVAKLQDSHHLDEASAIRMLPDFALCGPDGVPCAVADAKYKAERRGGYPDADLYQMLAYCTALGLEEGHLVYAKGNASHAAHRVRHAGIVIHQHALDLDQEPAGLLADIAQVASRMVAD